MHLVNDNEVVIEHGLYFTIVPRITFLVGFESIGNFVGKFEVTFEIIVGFDNGMYIGDQSRFVQIFQMSRIQFVQNRISHARRDVPDTIFQFQFGLVKQLETEIVQDVGRGQY